MIDTAALQPLLQYLQITSGCASFSPAAIVQQLTQLMQQALAMFTLCLASHTHSCKVSPHLVTYETLNLTLQLVQTTSPVYAVSSIAVAAYAILHCAAPPAASHQATFPAAYLEDSWAICVPYNAYPVSGTHLN
jgi:hypothetical protein